MIHDLHAGVLACLELRSYLVCLIRCDQFGNRAIVDEDFQHGTPTPPIGRLDEYLCYDRFQAHGQKALGLLTQFPGQCVDNSIDCLYGTGGM